MAEKKKNGKDSNTPKYIKGFPLTGNKSPAYSFDIYDKAVQRDSTQLSSFFGSLTARPGIENVLQINREYREKAAQQDQQFRGGGKRQESRVANNGPIQSLENGGVIQHD